MICGAAGAPLQSSALPLGLKKKKNNSPNLSQIFPKKIQRRRQGVRETPGQAGLPDGWLANGLRLG